MGKDILVGGRWTQQQEATEKLLAEWEAKRGGEEEMWEDHSLEGKRQRLLEWLKETRETVVAKGLLCKHGDQRSGPWDPYQWGMSMTAHHTPPGWGAQQAGQTLAVTL